MQFQQNVPLYILGAVYGKQDVTNTVRDLVNKGFTQIRADNQNFSDSFYGVQKTLVIVYQYGNYAPGVIVAKEEGVVCISPNQKNHSEWYAYQPGQISILGAAYGPSVVTDKVITRIKDGSLDISATNEVFGDSWHGVQKVLTIVYRDQNGAIHTVFAEEGHKIKIEGPGFHQLPQQIPTILGAAYGKYNVTDQISASVADGCLQISAENNVLGDGFENVEKSLVVVYRFGHGAPQTGITREHQTLTIKQSGQPNHVFTEPGQARILGAAYGLADVTTKMASYINNSELNIVADNNNLGDGWPNVRKTLVVVYQDPQGNVSTAIAEEGEHVKITFKQSINNGNNFYQGGQGNYQPQPQPQYYGGGGHNQPHYGGQQQYGGYQPQPQPQYYGGPYVGGYQPYGGQQYNNNGNNGNPYQQNTMQPQQYGNGNMYQQQTVQPQGQQYNNNQQFGEHAKQL